MKDLLRLFTPPEWGEWRLLAKLAYVVVFAGIMIPVYMFAQWLSLALIPD